MPALIAAIGLGIQAVGAIQSANANSQAASYNAARAAQNATIAGQQAAEDERVFRVGLRSTIGKMRANAGASGLQIEGSNEDIIANAAAQGELDAQKIHYGGQLKALGFQSDYDLSTARASAYGTSGYLSAAGSLLKGGTQAYSNFSGYGRAPEYDSSGAESGVSDAWMAGVEE